MLALVGGGARSTWWAQLIADVLQLPVHTHPDSEAGAAMGAARLAQLACGGREEEVCHKPDIQAEYLPQTAFSPMLGERLNRFRQLYTALKPVFKLHRK